MGAAAWVSVSLVAVVLLAGCSSGEGPSGAAPAEADSSAEPDPEEPSRVESEQVTSAVDVSAVTTQSLGAALPLTPASRGDEFADRGYTEMEYLVSGTADVYSGASGGPAVVAERDVPYTTRILVCYPDDPADFSGRVVVEPLNTSGLRDSDSAWNFIGGSIVDQGDAWVGVTVRNLSLDPLLEVDPQRYEALELSTNGLEWDILSQLGSVLKDGAEQSPLASYDVEHVYMTGYSQSAIDVTTFASTFNADARMTDASSLYDGYLIMSRSANSTPLDSGDAMVPAFEPIVMGKVDVPLVETETETDVEGYQVPEFTKPSSASVRRADADESGDRYRLYEIPGAAHSNASPNCSGGGTTFPQQYVSRAAYRNLVAWAEDGRAPVSIDRMDTESIGTVSVVARDEHGNGLGGLRSPWIVAPLSSYAPHDPTGPFTCLGVGVETPLGSSVTAELYGDAATYLSEFEAALDASIDEGLLLDGDREAILDEARQRVEEVGGLGPVEAGG